MCFACDPPCKLCIIEGWSGGYAEPTVVKMCQACEEAMGPPHFTTYCPRCRGQVTAINCYKLPATRVYNRKTNQYFWMKRMSGDCPNCFLKLYSN